MRWGLVLGGGGVLGAAWTVGALRALEQVHGLDPRDAEIILGTSAGSVTAALLGAGVSGAELQAHQLGDPARSGPLAQLGWDYETATGGSRPARPKWGVGSPAMVGQRADRLRQLPPTAVLSALMPEGRGSLELVGRLIADVQAGVGADPQGWSPHPGMRAVAMSYDTGRRVCFGDPAAPKAPLAQAVMASCAIPGWYSPVVIDQVRYVDGGAASSTNIDLLAGLGLDHVYALAPMASFSLDRPTSLPARLERVWRERVTRRALREVAKVHALGSEVTVLGPGAADLEAIGANLMDVRRRRYVLETALATTSSALREPESLDALVHRLESDVTRHDEESEAR
jgi:NTE family protein